MHLDAACRASLRTAARPVPALLHSPLALIQSNRSHKLPDMTPAPLSTINDLFCRVAAAANPRAILWQDEFGHWQPISSDQIYQRVRALSEAFLDWGAKKGDSHRPHQRKSLGVGRHRLRHSRHRRRQRAHLSHAHRRADRRAARAMPAAASPLSPRASNSTSSMPFARKPSSSASSSWTRRAARGRHRLQPSSLPAPTTRGPERDPVFDALVRSVEPGDLATLIYTSGTTGEPKGVMLTHGNIAANQNFAAVDFGFNPTDACISFLPLSHITARALDYVMYNHGAQVAYCSQFDKLPQAMKEIRPTVFVGVPRVYEKIRQAVEQKSARLARQEAHPCLGYQRRRAASRHGLWRPPALLAALEAGQQARLLQSARSLRRPRPHLRLRRRAARHRHRKMVRLGRHRGVGGLRPHRNLARHRPQYSRQPAHGCGGQAACPTSS